MGTQTSFYEPWGIGGARIWLDAAYAVFVFVNETQPAPVAAKLLARRTAAPLRAPCGSAIF